MLGAADSADAGFKLRAEEIRKLMLAELGDSDQSPPALVRRVLFARDIQGLWYLRSDIMAFLATRHGETEARARMEKISRRFKGTLPGSLAARPSNLGR